MSLLSAHLEQLELCAQSIATLPFPPPKIFTNALLSNHDITALIRDTEPHERALFSVPPPPPSFAAQAATSTNRRQTVFAVSSGEITTSTGPSARAPRKNTAVAAVLGGELHSQIRKTESVAHGGRGEMDVDVLLRGAEKLGNVWPVPGLGERINSLRIRHRQLKTSLGHYQQKIDKQESELEKLNRGEEWEEDHDGEEDDDDAARAEREEENVEITDEDLWREEEEIKELEAKKRELEERIRGMERDLGGLMR
ncbi:DASH complex subunit Spc34 [Xylogone sp. PMI_703]|nr:DASH complex subunit Spc34 [Xylogone sp. PMI_703]